MTKDRLINAARWVGITNDTLSVEFMQQDMFKRAEECMKPEALSPISEPTGTSGPSLIKFPIKRRGSASYWRDKFQQAKYQTNERKITNQVGVHPPVHCKRKFFRNCKTKFETFHTTQCTRLFYKQFNFKNFNYFF